MNLMWYLHIYRIETQQFGGLTVKITLLIYNYEKHNKLDMTQQALIVQS